MSHFEGRRHILLLSLSCGVFGGRENGLFFLFGLGFFYVCVNDILIDRFFTSSTCSELDLSGLFV